MSFAERPYGPGPDHLRGVAIGAGYFSRFQYEAWTRIPEVEIAALSNRTEAKARVLMADHNVPRFYADWREMLDRERPDMVDVITPPDTHEEMCAFAAARGIHIICQKPLAPTLEAATRIVENAEAAGVRLMVHENFRWQPWYRALKQVQQRGTIGDFTHIHMLTRLGDGWGDDAYLARQPFFRDYPRLLLYETGVHFVDTFRFLLGEVETVYAQLRRLNPVIRGEDTGQLVMRFDSGATAIWDANRFNEVEAEDPRFTFGVLRIDGTGGHLTMDATSAIRIKPLGQPAVDLDYTREHRGFAGDCVYAVQRHFVDCMRTGDEFESTGRDYLHSMRVIEAAYHSATRDVVVHLENTGRSS